MRWYAEHGRDLPWRNRRNPYRVLVSEIMLQQTQVHRVLQKYPLFLRKFPTIQALARARQHDVVIAWRGMGYNRRAVNLHRLARVVAGNPRKTLPKRYSVLISLPGIGRYTANAILSSAFKAQVPAVDVNVRRVLSRLFLRMRTLAQLGEENEVWELAESLLPRGKAYVWNQALMDLGAMICTSRKPACEQCPVYSHCTSGGHMTPSDRRPAKAEPSFAGIPNRIHRGRVIEELRKHTTNGGTIRISRLGTLIGNPPGRNSDRWLSGLLSGLQRDGLITMEGKGTITARRVRLA
jgi:A/G-specific adenine glycosylase